MKLLMLALAILVCAPMGAQDAANFQSQELKNSWIQIRNLIERGAEKMPEENYPFKPTDKIRSFGALTAHIADGYLLICGAEKGEKKEMTVEKAGGDKAALLKALKEAAAYCDSSYNAVTDAKAGEVVKFFGRDRSRMGVLYTNILHSWEHYGNMVTYLRLKDIVPPSSEPRPSR